ncbi:uncharacterized protein F4822DRAFT_432941 [Hypoxylon trugodes]|uniref:uncharacterized protein n=1 Tax=Hypoxylon trugodes TaxID=326681 RepID=UPI002191B632|nr:uncharacterized protein F4822DRAFT_432941 [Hypoxylon trugodes]KAI1384395.1 hypothetical protein F4822DRAFT_432941 [Hypoxylon trugodes]
MAAAEFMINTRKMRYTGDAMAALKGSGVDANLATHDQCPDNSPVVVNNGNGPGHCCPGRVWLESEVKPCPPRPATGRHIGTYALTTDVAQWVKNALANYKPGTEVLELVRPFAAEFHTLVEKERKSSFGLHDLDAIELTYQSTLEIGAAILLAANDNNDPVDLSIQLHASRAGGDDHFKSWGKLLTGLECDPPIIVQFPFYLMMCQAFTFEPNTLREDYVYSAMTGVDWAKGQNKFNDRLAAFEALARESVPTLEDTKSGEDRCFWRIALAYLHAMNGCENARSFKTPRKAAIEHGLDPDLVIAARALDTIGSAYMCRDGAAWLDNEGMDSLIGSALPNDVMDLHTDIFTGETRNLLRLLYPPGNNITQTIKITSTILSTMLCEIFRGHHRARMHNREDGRISSTSPPYSFCRARHRRVFETLELYINRYPQFWEWTWEIYRAAKSQITEAAIAEPIVCGLKRARNQTNLPASPTGKFFKLWYDMIEDGSAQLAKKQPLGVSEDLAPTIRDLHSLWHQELLRDNKGSGWGREFDQRSDRLLGEAGDVLASRGGISEDMYKFSIAYGRLSMGLPYVAYHTVDAIIMAFGALP